MGKELVQVKVDSDRLEAWDEYHEESPEFSDRSDLIRKSVERTISPDTDEQDTQDAIGRAEALEQFERLEGILNELEREVNIVQEGHRKRRPNGRHRISTELPSHQTSLGGHRGSR